MPTNQANDEQDGRLGSTIRAYLPELIYGANDGIVTTFAIIACVTGGQLSTQVVLILGFANLFADGASMAASNVLSERSKTDPRPSLRQASRKGMATFVGFVLAGVVPLLAYLLFWSHDQRFLWTVVVSGVTLFAIGSGRALFTGRAWYRAGMEMFVIGLAAGAIAYGVGVFLARLAGGPAGG